MSADFSADFFAEAEELIDALYTDLEALHRAAQQGAMQDQIVERIFRRVHTIKGGAAMAELDCISVIANDFESLLDGVRQGRVKVTPRVLQVLDAGVLAISDSFRLAERGETAMLLDLARDFQREIAEDKRRIESDVVSQAQVELLEENAGAFTRDESQPVNDLSGPNARLFVLNVRFCVATFDQDFRRLGEQLINHGHIVSTHPSINQDQPDKVDFQLIYRTLMTRAEVMEMISRVAAAMARVELEEVETAADETTMLSHADAFDAGVPKCDTRDEVGGVITSDESGSETNSTATAQVFPAAASVRVPHEKLNRVVDAIDALQKQAMNGLEAVLKADLPPGTRIAIEQHQHLLRQRFGELTEQLRALQTALVETLLQRAVRAGIVAARAAGKQVDFEINHRGIHLDKALIDNLHEPLLHLLRNAIDHGIEPAAERAANSKAACGRVRLEAEREDAWVVLRVTDDGRGVDVERVRQVAVSRNMLTANEKLDLQQALRLIVQPGFTTAGNRSLLSGRGVGLDVVVQAIKQIGGELRVHTHTGVGTTFELRLPATTIRASSAS